MTRTSVRCGAGARVGAREYARSMAGPHRLTRADARRIIVRAALLDGERPGDIVEVAEQLGQIKIDPTTVIAPAEDAIPWARIGWSYEPAQRTKATEIDRLVFEFDGALRPISMLPLMLPAMREWPTRAEPRAWLEQNARFAREVLARLRADGPLFAAEIDDTAQVAHSSADGWYGPGQVPRMLEYLQRRGEVAVVRRRGRQRQWDLAERVYPSDSPEHTAADAERILNERRLQSAGLARTGGAWTRVGDAGEPAEVEGLTSKWRVDPEALAALDEDRGGRVAILNPYDRVLFDRPRLRDVFGFEYVLEQFKPKHQRVYGYFAHPILCGDRFIGLLDAAVDREESTLRVDNLHELEPWDPDEAEAVHAELDELAAWLGVRLAGV